MKAALCLTLICMVTGVAARPLSSLDYGGLSKFIQSIIAEVSDSPPNFNDVQDELDKYRLAYSWLLEYKYCSFVKQPSEMSLDDIKVHICKPVRRVKRFYRLDSQNCLITKELLDIMSKPRCAKADDEATDEARRKRWSRLGSTVWPNWSTVPVTYRLTTPLLNSAILTLAVQKAAAKFCADLWDQNSGLSMRENTTKANIDIHFKYIDGPYNVVGRALSPSTSGSYLYLDSSETWKISRSYPGAGVSLQWAMCHEMGHNLGLGHSGDRNAIMYPSGVGQDDSRLHTDDIAGIQTLYPFARG